MGRRYNGRRPQHRQFASGTRKAGNLRFASSSTGNLNPAKPWQRPSMRRDVRGEWRRTIGMSVFIYAMGHFTVKQGASDKAIATATSKIIARRSNTLRDWAAG